MPNQIGNTVYLKSLLANLHIFGVVSDGETPDQFVATMEIAGENATMTLDALVGPQGPAGEHAFALALQRSAIDEPEDLPTNLTIDDEDVGKYWVMNHYDQADEAQQITVTGAPTGGTWTLTFAGETTTPLPFDADPLVVAAALEALSSIGSGNITVDGIAGQLYTATFGGILGATEIEQMSADGSALTGGSAPAVTVTTAVEGGLFLLGSRAYVWMGDHYKVLMMGSEGQPGPVPIITWGISLLDPDGPEDSYMEQSGTAYRPTVTAHIKAPRGPQGPATSIAQAPDVDMTLPPEPGQVLMYDGINWKPQWLSVITSKPYTVPEAAFTNYQGLSTRAPIGSFAVPPQPFAWKPIVWGKIRANGLELDADPLIIGCEVRLGDPTTGQLVARGFGNNSGWTTITPHTSTPTTPSDAMTPDNDYARVNPNHTGTEGTLYVNLYNDGLTGVYLFNNANAQLYVSVTPV